MTKRLNRAESQAMTRERLIESATDLYLANGYAATSNDQVAAHAGFSRGAVYSNFASKEELGLEVLDRFLAREVAAVDSALGSGTVAERLDALEAWAVESAGERSWGLLKSELAVQSRHSPTLRERLSERDHQLWAGVESQLDLLFREVGIALPIRSATLARLLIDTTKGIALDMAVNESSTEWLSEILQMIRLLAGIRGATPPP